MRGGKRWRVVEPVADHERPLARIGEAPQPGDLVGGLHRRLEPPDAELPRHEGHRRFAIPRQDLDLVSARDVRNDRARIGAEPLPDGEDDGALAHPQRYQRGVRPRRRDPGRLRFGPAPGDGAEPDAAFERADAEALGTPPPSSAPSRRTPRRAPRRADAGSKAPARRRAQGHRRPLPPRSRAPGAARSACRSCRTRSQSASARRSSASPEFSISPRRKSAPAATT